jgi:hypothetical protein
MDDARTARELRMHYNILFAQDYTPKVWLPNSSNNTHAHLTTLTHPTNGRVASYGVCI